MIKHTKRECSYCRRVFSAADLFTSDQIRPSIVNEIIRSVGSWSEDSVICASCLDRCRVQHLQNLIEQERGELTALDEQVLNSLVENELVARNTSSQYHESLSLGQKLSDRMAAFGGSWLFLIAFGLFLLSWILFNSFGPKPEEFDPYPYILLNLILSCLAAIQAPIIMMSQNRQEAKDRLRSEQDYQVNLKAELEVRQLHMKIDQLLKHQWSRLLEIQQLQIELMRESTNRTSHESKDGRKS